MTAKNKYDYSKIKQEVVDALRKGASPTWKDLGRVIGIDSGTLKSAAEREWKVH